MKRNLKALRHEIEAFLLEEGADLTGFADVSDLYGEFKSAIVFAVSLEKLRKLASAHRTTLEAFAPYFIDRIAVHLMEFLRRKGYKAKAILMGDETVPLELVVNKKIYAESFKLKINQVKLAVRAGLGVKGRNNLLVTPQYGPRVMIMSVLTDAELPADKPVSSFDPCKSCFACIKVCLYKISLKEGLSIDCMRCRACIDICPAGSK